MIMEFPYFVKTEINLHSTTKILTKSGFKTEEEAKKFRDKVESGIFNERYYGKNPMCFTDWSDGDRKVYLDFQTIECFEVTVEEW